MPAVVIVTAEITEKLDKECMDWLKRSNILFVLILNDLWGGGLWQMGLRKKPKNESRKNEEDFFRNSD